MALKKITYENKINTKEVVDRTKQSTADDWNEVKEVVNLAIDEVDKIETSEVIFSVDSEAEMTAKYNSEVAAERVPVDGKEQIIRTDLNEFWRWNSGLPAKAEFSRKNLKKASEIKAGNTDVAVSGHVADYVVNHVQEELKPLQSPRTNLYDKTIFTAGYLHSITGAFNALANSKTSDYIPVIPDTDYYLSGRVAMPSVSIVFYDENKNILPSTNPQSENDYDYLLNGLLKSPSNSSFVRFTCIFNGVGSVDAIQFEIGSINTDYEDYTTFNIYPKNESYNKIESDARYPVLEAGKKIQLFDKKAVESGYLSVTSGGVNVLDNSELSDYIPVIPDTDYYLSGRNLSGTTAFVWYNESRIALPPITGNNYDEQLNGIFTSPSDAYFCRFTSVFNGSGVSDNIQFEKGSSATSYVDYEVPLKIPESYLPSSSVIGNSGVLIDIRNSDKITVFGNSYTEGYSMYKKHYLDNLSMFSDYQFRNYGKSGDDLLEILHRVRNNETRFGNVTLRDFGTTYGIIACRDNNLAMYSADIDTYYYAAQELARSIETLGAKPILSTEHQVLSNGLFNAFEKLSQEKGYTFMNWARAAAQLRGNTYFSPFYNNAHPSTRTGWLWSNGMKPYIDALPKVEKGLKLFRVRNSSSISNVSDLIYESNIDRAKLYEEIVIGQTGLSEATEKYFDRLNTTSEVYVAYNDEYLKLQNNEAVNFVDYFLSEVIIPYTSQNVNYLKLNFTATGVSKVYVKKTIGLTTYLSHVGTSDEYLSSFKKPVGEWFELTINDGDVILPTNLFGNVINYDKISFLFEGENMSFTDINVNVNGVGSKNRNNLPELKVIDGPELLTDYLLDDGTSWEGISSIPSFSKIEDINNPGVLEVFPYGITTVRLISGSNKLIQQIPSMPASYRDAKVQVRVICRNFPAYISNDEDWLSSGIKRESYDCENLRILIQSNSQTPVVVASNPVGLYWQELFVDAILEAGSNKIVLESDNDLQVGLVSVIKKP